VNNPDDDTDYYLFGSVKDAGGNSIEAAEIYIQYDGINALADNLQPRDPWNFIALLTADNYVRLSWVTESETSLLGYRLLRSESNVITSAYAIAPIFLLQIRAIRVHTRLPMKKLIMDMFTSTGWKRFKSGVIQWPLANLYYD
jgi:hypothetical protein